METSWRCRTAAVRFCALLLLLVTLTPAVVLAGEGRTFADIFREYKARNPNAGENKYRAEGACDKSCIVSPPSSPAQGVYGRGQDGAVVS